METSFLTVTQILHGNLLPRIMDDHEDNYVLTTLILDSYCLMMLTSQVHSQTNLSNPIIPRALLIVDGYR